LHVVRNSRRSAGRRSRAASGACRFRSVVRLTVPPRDRLRSRLFRRTRLRVAGVPMSVDLKVPSLGESVRQATVEKWLKKQGEFVKRDEPVVSLESDKANVEVPAPVGGVLKEIVKAAGQTVAIGEVIARIEPSTMRYTRSALQGGTPAIPAA